MLRDDQWNLLCVFRDVSLWHWMKGRKRWWALKVKIIYIWSGKEGRGECRGKSVMVKAIENLGYTSHSRLQEVIDSKMGEEQKVQYWLLASQHCVFLFWFLPWDVCAEVFFLFGNILPTMGLNNRMWCDVIKNCVFTVSGWQEGKKIVKRFEW